MYARNAAVIAGVQWKVPVCPMMTPDLSGGGGSAAQDVYAAEAMQAAVPFWTAWRWPSILLFG